LKKNLFKERTVLNMFQPAKNRIRPSSSEGNDSNDLGIARFPVPS